MSRVLDVLGLRGVMMMVRCCKRHSRRSNRSNNKDREDFLQKIVHETKPDGRGFDEELIRCISKCRHSVAQRFYNLKRVNNALSKSVVLLPTTHFKVDFTGSIPRSIRAWLAARKSQRNAAGRSLAGATLLSRTAGRCAQYRCSRPLGFALRTPGFLLPAVC
jgi:hypothetical protein